MTVLADVHFYSEHARSLVGASFCYSMRTVIQYIQYIQSITLLKSKYCSFLTGTQLDNQLIKEELRSRATASNREIEV